MDENDAYGIALPVLDCVDVRFDGTSGGPAENVHNLKTHRAAYHSP